MFNLTCLGNGLCISIQSDLVEASYVNSTDCAGGLFLLPERSNKWIMKVVKYRVSQPR